MKKKKKNSLAPVGKNVVKLHISHDRAETKKCCELKLKHKSIREMTIVLLQGDCSSRLGNGLEWNFGSCFLAWHETNLLTWVWFIKSCCKQLHEKLLIFREERFLCYSSQKSLHNRYFWMTILSANPQEQNV